MGWGLRLLWRCLPSHPLCDVFNPNVARKGYELRWLLSWDEIFGNHSRLEKYSKEMALAIEQYERDPNRSVFAAEMSKDNDAEITEFGLFDTKEAAEEMISTTMHQMSLSPSTSTPDPFLASFKSLCSTLHQNSSITSTAAITTTTLPLLSLLSQSSFHHALSLQSNLLQASLLTLFFQHLSLQQHLSVLHSYLLFGNGVFITKLNEALFDDFDEDGRSGGLHGLGLGVGLVDRWPPSASKVQGVLRNVLEELGQDGTMGISFAYRELEDREFDKVKNPVGTIPHQSYRPSLPHPDPRFRTSIR